MGGLGIFAVLSFVQAFVMTAWLGNPLPVLGFDQSPDQPISFPHTIHAGVGPLVDTETGEPITTELLRYGFRVSILALPAPKNLCTKKALEVVGPKGFGYDFEYENLLKIPRK